MANKRSPKKRRPAPEGWSGTPPLHGSVRISLADLRPQFTNPSQMKLLSAIHAPTGNWRHLPGGCRAGKQPTRTWRIVECMCPAAV
jgi:hypothetical protein